MIVTPRFAWLLVAAASVPALAQQTPPAIHGRVFAADNREALPRARVIIVVDGLPGSPAYTDDRGEFTIAVPSARTFALSIVKAGFAATQIPLQRAAFATTPRDIAIALTRSAAVNGRIVDTTGETVVGLRVYADRLDPIAINAVGPVKFATTTDDRGEYRLGGLPPGRYSVTATNALDPGAVVTVALQPGDNVSGIDFTSRPPADSAISPTPQPPETRDRATIRGRVISTARRPIAQAVVNVSGPMAPRYVLTDAQGRFTFPGLIPGDYEVRASRGDFLPGSLGQQTAFESTSRIAVTRGARVDDVTLVLSRGLAVTGMIVDRAGEPLQGVSVQALHVTTSGNRKHAVLAGALQGGDRQTDDRGRYRVLGLQPGTYVIAALADAASLGDGATTSQPIPIYFPGSSSIADAVTVTITRTDVDGIDFALRDLPMARVTGVALDSTGAPLMGPITLAVSNRSGSIIPNSRSTQAGTDGAFTFFSVAPGDYVVLAMRFALPGVAQLARGINPIETLEVAVQDVTVGERDAEPVHLRTTRAAMMEGRIVFDSARPRDPYDRMQIEALPADLDLSLLLSGDYARARVMNGRFRLPALFGVRRFVVSEMPDGLYLKSITINGSDVTDQEIDFGVGGASTVSAEVVISATGGSIVGRITGQKPTPAGASIVVFPQDREKWFERSRFVKVVRASQDGSFRATSLPPGDYYVALTANLDGSSATTPDALEPLLSRASKVTLNEGEEQRVAVAQP